MENKAHSPELKAQKKEPENIKISQIFYKLTVYLEKNPEATVVLFKHDSHLTYRVLLNSKKDLCYQCPPNSIKMFSEIELGNLYIRHEDAALVEEFYEQYNKRDDDQMGLVAQSQMNTRQSLQRFSATTSISIPKPKESIDKVLHINTRFNVNPTDNPNETYLELADRYVAEIEKSILDAARNRPSKGLTRISTDGFILNNNDIEKEIISALKEKQFKYRFFKATKSQVGKRLTVWIMPDHPVFYIH